MWSFSGRTLTRVLAVYRPLRATGWLGIKLSSYGVSGVIYRLYDLAELCTEFMEGGDESLEQTTRNDVSLPANRVYRPE
jgi:hypothetical protein